MKVFCDKCPCLNNDYESGSECNLGFDTDYANFTDGEWHDFSENCRLKTIQWFDGHTIMGRDPEPIPVGVEKVERPRRPATTMERVWMQWLLGREQKSVLHDSFITESMSGDRGDRVYIRKYPDVVNRYSK